MKDGAELEGFIQFVYSKLLSNEDMKDINVRKNYKYRGKTGVEHEFDVYYEMNVAGNIHYVAIECKDYAGPVEKRDVAEFYGKLVDCNNLQGIMVSRNGYRDSAKQFADGIGIKTVLVKDLPSIPQIAAMDIKKVLLPDETTIGKPFWVAMEITENKETTGNYHVIDERGEKLLPLFFSKKAAQTYLTNRKLTKECGVFGVSKQQLGFLCDSYKIANDLKIGVCPLLSGMIDSRITIIQVDNKKLREEFL